MKAARVADRHPGGASRNRDLQLIHIAKKALNMDIDAYRAIVLTISNQRTSSSADLSQEERAKLLNHLKACGFTPAPARRADATKQADDPKSRKARSLWIQLAEAGLVNDRREAGLVAFVKHTTGVDRLEWLTDRQSNQVIEALKKWLGRA